MAEEESTSEEKSGGGGGSKLLIIILIAMNFLTLAGVAAFVLLGRSSPEPAAVAAAEGEEGAEGGAETDGEKEGDPEKPDEPAEVLGPIVKLGIYTINLNSMGEARYLKADIQAEVSSEETSEEVKMRTPQIRDMLISYLSSLTIKDTYGAKAKARIRDNIERRVNQVLVSGEVRRVFFTDFMTQ